MVIITCRWVVIPDQQPLNWKVELIIGFIKVFYSACPAQCESQNSNETVDPRKPVALSHVTNIPGLMRVVHSE